MQSRHPEADIAAAIKAISGRPGLPPQLDPGIADDLPDGPGVYLFYGENAQPLYVGKARNIRERVLAHFAGDRAADKKLGLAQQLRRIDWILTGGEIGALLKEAALVKELQPAHNRHLRRNDELCALCLVDHGAGRVKPQIVFARDLDFGAQNDLYGPFKSAREATKVLAELAAAHGLCHALLGLEDVAAGKPCFAYQIKRCKGACVGAEPPAAHTLRLMRALARLRLKSWPFAGPAGLREGEELLVFDHWRYLGTAKAEDEVWPLLDAGRPPFDRDIYRILVKVADRMQPLQAS